MSRLLRVYRRVNRFGHGVRQRLTPLGGWLAGGWIAAGAFGINTREGMTYQLFVLLTVLFVVALLASRFGSLPVTATRLLPRFATVGQPLRYGLHIANQGIRAQPDLLAFDELRDAPPAPVSLGRLPTYRQWSRWSAWARGANNLLQPLPILPPQANADSELSLTPLRRGWLEFAALRFARPEPLGLLRRQFRQPLPDRLLVLPRRYPVPLLHFHDGRRYQRGGVNLAQSVGEEDEFIGLRDYRPGDPWSRNFRTSISFATACCWTALPPGWMRRGLKRRYPLPLRLRRQNAARKPCSICCSSVTGPIALPPGAVWAKPNSCWRFWPASPRAAISRLPSGLAWWPVTLLN